LAGAGGGEVACGATSHHECAESDAEGGRNDGHRDESRDE
jgi:hypothetical protein